MKILFELMTGVGPLIRCLPIALELQKKGHNVHYFSRDNGAKYMNSVGLTQIDFNPELVSFKPHINPFWKTTDEWMGAFGYNDYEWIEKTQKSWQSFLSDFKPDLIVSDTGILSSIAAKVLNIPLVMLTQSCFHPGVKNGKLRFWTDDNENCVESRDTVNKYLNRMGLGEISTFDDLFTAEKTLIPGIPEFEQFEKGFDKDLFFSGPVLWDGLVKDNRNSEAAVFENGKPTVFCYTGRFRDSAGNSGELIFNAILESLGNENVNVLISTGGLDNAPPGDGYKKYDNIRLVDWIRMEDAYSNSDLIIHHGGHGSCMGNFIYGKPAVIIPTHTEREYNAHLMESLGSGLIINRNEINGDALSEKTKMIFSDQRFARINAELGQRIKNNYSNSAEVAADFILN